jgi:hypothetical protein
MDLPLPRRRAHAWATTEHPALQRISPGNKTLDATDLDWFDIAMEQTSVVGVVLRLGDAVAPPRDLGGVDAIDVVHGDPELAFVLASVVHADDVRMPQRCREVGFAVEACPEFRVGRDSVGRIFSASRRGSRGCSAR